MVHFFYAACGLGVLYLLLIPHFKSRESVCFGLLAKIVFIFMCFSLFMFYMSYVVILNGKDKGYINGSVR